MLRTLQLPSEWLPSALESQAISGYTELQVPVAAGASDQAVAAFDLGIIGPGLCSVFLVRPASSSRLCPPLLLIPKLDCTCSATRCPERGTRWG